MDSTKETVEKVDVASERAAWQSWLWLLAGLVAVGLLLATGTLFLEQRARPDRFVGTVAGPAGAVYLRSHPHPSSSVVTILGAGDALQAEEQRDVEGTLWYRVRTAQGEGWLPAERVERGD